MPAPTASTRLRAQGIDALKARQFDAAVALLNRYLDLASNDTEAELALAAARSGQGKHGAALVIFERHLENEPRSPSLHFNRGTTLERLGRKDDAVKAYKMVLQLKPDHAKSQQRLQTLGGMAAPLPARRDIPMVIPLDDNEDDGGPRARRQMPKDRWIHPAWLAVLFLYAVGLTALAGTLVSAYAAGRVAGELLLANIFLLAGIQAVHDARRGKKHRPAALGYVLAGLGAVGLISSPVDPIVSMILMSQFEERRAADEKVRQEQARVQRAQLEARQAELAVQRRKRQAERFDEALQDIQSGNSGRITVGCVTLWGMRTYERRAEVVSLLENLVNHKDVGVRMRAAQTLGVWGTRASIPKLEALLIDKASVVRSTAEESINKIKKREPAAPEKGTS